MVQQEKDVGGWWPLTGEELGWLERIQLQRENLALRHELLARDEARIRSTIAQRVGDAGDAIEVDMAGLRVRRASTPVS